MPHAQPDLFHFLLQAHPWHGISPGDDVPKRVTAYIEIVPTDTVKYELDKPSGLLRVDRPQRFSSLCPTLYGFIPQTYCGDDIGKRCADAVGRTGPGGRRPPEGSAKGAQRASEREPNIAGDGDPLDICVVTEKAIPKGGFLLEAVPLGGLRMIDGNEADDKIIAVLADDPVYGEAKDVADLPTALVDRLRHYFLTYKQIPGEGSSWSKAGGWKAAPSNPKIRQVEIPEIYGRKESHEVIRASQRDYAAKFGDPKVNNEKLAKLLR